MISEPRLLHIADLNNDGWLDLVVPDIVSERSLILWGGPAGFSLERRQLLAVRHACCARTADLTGNGYLDLLIGGHQPSLDGPHDSLRVHLLERARRAARGQPRAAAGQRGQLP